MPPSMKLNAEYRAPERALKPSRPPAADAFSAIVAAAAYVTGSIVALVALGAGALAFGLAALLLAALYGVLYRTTLGRQMRAVAQNRRGAQLIGINVDRVYLIAFGVSCGLAAVAGVLVSVLLFASPTVGLVFALKAFAIIVMAGLGNLTGVLWASVLLGVSEALVQTYVPGGGGWSDAVFFLMIFGTLVLRSYRGAR